MCSVFASFLERGTNLSPSPAALFGSAKINDITARYSQLCDVTRNEEIIS